MQPLSINYHLREKLVIGYVDNDGMVFLFVPCNQMKGSFVRVVVTPQQAVALEQRALPSASIIPDKEEWVRKMFDSGDTPAEADFKDGRLRSIEFYQSLGYCSL